MLADPQVLAHTAKATAASLADRYPSPMRAFAEPPPGSGLRPVLGDAGPPVLGYTLNFLEDTVRFCRDRYGRFGEVSWMAGFGQNLVMVLGPEGTEEVLTNRGRAFSSEEGWGYFLVPFFARGVMLMDFEEHRLHRRIMQGAFKRERLVEYLADMTPTIADGVSGWQPDSAFRLFDATKELAFEVATKVFVGTEPSAAAERLSHAFVECVNGAQSVIRADVPGGAWHRGLTGRKLLEEYFRSQLAAKRAGHGRDLFNVLCHAESEEGERFTDEDVVDHMIFVLLAAHDTSTITLTMLAYYLAKHPEWQERLRAETRALGKDALGFDDLERLPLLDMAFRETLRMNAPVGLLVRRAREDTQIQGHYVPAGTRLFVALSASHRIARWWHDPDAFDPERFSEERREDQTHKFAWAPFGGNVHKCIGMHFGGMEVKSIMHQMLLRYSWSVPAGYEPPMTFGTGPMPADGLPIRLEVLA
jgi:cytochrome P450